VTAGYQPWGQARYPSPPPPRGNGGLIAAIIVAVVLSLLMAAGAVVVAFSLGHRDRPGTGVAVPAATTAPLAAGPQSVFAEAGFTITFRYPRDMRRAKVSIGRAGGSTAKAQWAVGFPGTESVIILTKYQLRQPVTAANVSTTVSEADELFGQLAGHPVHGHATEVGGMPAIEYAPTALSEPPAARSTLLLVFDGDVEYLVNCQATPDKRRQLEAACTLARSSLQRR
jgi:hypothetical protein